MNNPAMRTAAGAVLGIIVGGAVVFAVETIGHSMYPPPDGIDLSDPEAVKSLIASLPVAALVMVLVGWLVGSFAGAWAARRVGQSDVAAWIVAGAFIAFTAFNFVMIPHPLWMMAIGVLIPLATAWLVTRLTRSTQPA